MLVESKLDPSADSVPMKGVTAVGSTTLPNDFIMLPSSGAALSLPIGEAQLTALPERVVIGGVLANAVPSRLFISVSTYIFVAADYLQTAGGQRFTVDPLTSAAEFGRLAIGDSDGLAFSNVDGIRDQAGPRVIRHLVHYLRTFFRPSYGRDLAKRIDTLAKTLKEDYGESAEISTMSLYYLIAFLETHLDVRRPALAASPNGCLIANWRESGSRRLSIEFMASGAVRYFLVEPNSDHPDVIERHVGNSTADSVFERINLARLGWLRE